MYERDEKDERDERDERDYIYMFTDLFFTYTSYTSSTIISQTRFSRKL